MTAAELKRKAGSLAQLIECRFPRWNARSGEYDERKMSEWAPWGKYRTEEERGRTLENLRHKFAHSDWRLRWEFRAK